MFISPLLHDPLRRWCRWSAIAPTSRAAIALHDAVMMHDDAGMMTRGDDAQAPALRLTILNAGAIQAEDIIGLGHRARIRSLHIDAPSLSAQALVGLLPWLPGLREVEIERLDWTAPGDLPEGMTWTLHHPPESMLGSLPLTSRSLTLRGGLLTKRLCDGLKTHQTGALHLERCDAHGDASPWDASALEEVSFMGVPGALVARAISDQLNISSLGALKGTLDLKTPAARATLRGVQHLEAQHGDDIFEALWRDDAPLDALQSLQITPDGVTNTADLSPILRRATQLQALALHGVSPSAREVKGIPWSRLTALSLRGSAMERLDLSEQGAPALALLDASDTALRGVLDLTLSAPNLRALWGCGVKQLASEADHLPHAELRLLDLSFSDMTEGAARALFHPESFPCLRALNMEHLYQSALAPGEVAAWCGARPLMQVNLYKFAGDGEALGGALRRSARTLQIITLGNGTSCVGGVDAIEAEPFQALTHLQIDHALHPSELHRLLTALCATPLRHLSIALQADAALDVLLDAPLLRQLHSLSVGGAMTERRDLGADLILALLRDAGASPLLSLGWGYEVDL